MGKKLGLGVCAVFLFCTLAAGLAQASENSRNAPQNTSNIQITNGPNVDYVGSNRAKISWSTNVPSSSVVTYGTDPNLMNEVAEAPWRKTTHQLTLTNLNPDTKYYFRIQPAQGQGEGTMASGNVNSFHTVKNGESAMYMRH
jgi:phosphodiesterase/alkaline phosphatase D-like protein